ncbi:MAG: phosphoglycerate kinase [candidate division Zixibacteria bacterium]|nr:phosphoglycerate kinase [candidate division Zixibacteria bacterium]
MGWQVAEETAILDPGRLGLLFFNWQVRKNVWGESKVNPALFYNGVFGKFEDERFAAGTRSFIAALKRATDSGVRTYVGGGEGRMALLKYGKLEDVTHAFTAGGTILKSLGAKHIAYVKANYLQSRLAAKDTD